MSSSAAARSYELYAVRQQLEGERIRRAIPASIAGSCETPPMLVCDTCRSVGMEEGLTCIDDQKVGPARVPLPDTGQQEARHGVLVPDHADNLGLALHSACRPNGNVETAVETWRAGGEGNARTRRGEKIREAAKTELTATKRFVKEEFAKTKVAFRFLVCGDD